MSGWTVAWLLWVTVFVVVEGLALWHDRHGTTVDTLSQHVWGWFAVNTPQSDPGQGRWVKLRRFVLLTFLVWLTVHLLTGGWV